MLKNIFYKLLINFIRIFTPNLYQKILMNTNIFFINKIPRPIINIIKLYFNNNKSLIGCEIGVEEGKNAISIYNELNIKKLYLIDSWNNNNKDYNKTINLFKNKKKVIIIKENSKEAINQIPNNYLDFVYIDANHSYFHAYQDISLWSKKVKNNGLITGHDIQKLQVLKAIKNYCKEK